MEYTESVKMGTCKKSRRKTAGYNRHMARVVKESLAIEHCTSLFQTMHLRVTNSPELTLVI